MPELRWTYTREHETWRNAMNSELVRLKQGSPNITANSQLDENGLLVVELAHGKWKWKGPLAEAYRILSVTPSGTSIESIKARFVS